MINIEETVTKHIDAWEGRMVQIEKVAQLKGYKL